ncbi:MAG: hypothetical protein IPJ86_16480 [Bacteroidetes bacterium]|nr:hypothetical protein [Bacteroidota bacterium]
MTKKWMRLYLAFNKENTMKKHQHNHKRIFIAVLILISVIFLIVGPRAKADTAEKATASYIVQNNVHIVTVIKSILTN